MSKVEPVAHAQVFYVDDLVVGQRLISGETSIELDEIVGFAERFDS